MPYAIAVMRALVKDHGMLVDCIYWDTNKRTPFVPANENGITFHPRSAFGKGSILQFIDARSPSIIYVAGRMDRLYLQAALRCKNKSIIVTGCDNQWTGSIKQRIAALLSLLLYKRYFDYFWVPGKRQYKFAKRMGYTDKNIIPHLLTADSAVYGKVWAESKAQKKKSYPHTLVYVGRFAEEKGLDILISAFTELKREMANDWELTLVGSGNLPVSGNDFITVKGFMTATELAEEAKLWGAFCLPSRHEPWGVVIHEFAMAGLPIVCSDSAGAGDDLVQHNVNGFIFKNGDKDDLKRALTALMSKTDDELIGMGIVSYELSKMQSPEIAANSLINLSPSLSKGRG